MTSELENREVVDKGENDEPQKEDREQLRKVHVVDPGGHVQGWQITEERGEIKDQTRVKELIGKKWKGAFLFRVEENVITDLEHILKKVRRKNRPSHEPGLRVIPIREEEEHRKKSDDADVLKSAQPTLVLAHDEVVGLEYKIPQKVCEQEFEKDGGHLLQKG